MIPLRRQAARAVAAVAAAGGARPAGLSTMVGVSSAAVQLPSPAACQVRASAIPPQPLPPMDLPLPRYFELFQDHVQTFNRFSSDPHWVAEALAEKAQSVQQYYVEDSVRQQFDDSMMNIVDYFSRAHGCILLNTRRTFRQGVPQHTVVTLESPPSHWSKPTGHIGEQTAAASQQAQSSAPSAGLKKKGNKKKKKAKQPSAAEAGAAAA